MSSSTSHATSTTATRYSTCCSLQLLLCASLLTVLLAHFQVAESFGRGYFNVVGDNTAHKYCGETGDSCMFNNQCCKGFNCNFNDNYEGICKSPNNRGLSNLGRYNQGSSVSADSKDCSSNLDCDFDQCCKLKSNGPIGAMKNICSNDCNAESIEQGNLGRAHGPPVVGNYQGYNFWRRWQRSASKKKKRDLNH